MSTRFITDTGTAGVTTTVAPSIPWQLEEIRLHLSDVGGAGDLTATLDHEKGSKFDLNIITQDMTSIKDFVYQPDRPMEFGADTELDIAYANANHRTFGLEIVIKGS